MLIPTIHDHGHFVDETFILLFYLGLLWFQLQVRFPLELWVIGAVNLRLGSGDVIHEAAIDPELLKLKGEVLGVADHAFDQVSTV